MGQEFESDDCIRRRVVINGENYYLSIGEDFVIPTVPYENRPDREAERIVVETLCQEIGDVLGILKQRREEKVRQNDHDKCKSPSEQ